ncbi:CBN-CLIC-1 protein [Caenorhabditis brenneri]|uniref:Clathrin light chain n=1 Tax=Caenorhabditis brenneri TaxID=135651 RepID=G0MTL5_CAEBE|nr:CBN-CLIC-1 protein [Caenorhabditis brenneri]
MSDPVADFLAREQNLFADFDGAPPAAADPVAEAPAAAPALDDDFGELQIAEDNAPPAVHPTDSGVDLDGLMDDNVAPAIVVPAVEPLVNGNHGAASNGSSKGPSPILSSVPRIEAEKIRLWKAEQEKLLDQKDAAEEKKKAELKANAKKELEEWYKQREKTLQLSHEENLKNEKANQELFAKQQDGDAQWETVNKLVEQQKSKSGRDLSRLKTLLAGLKHAGK